MFRVHGLPSAKASARNMVEARPFFQGPGLLARFFALVRPDECRKGDEGKKKRTRVAAVTAGPQQDGRSVHRARLGSAEANRMDWAGLEGKKKSTEARVCRRT